MNLPTRAQHQTETPPAGEEQPVESAVLIRADTVGGASVAGLPGGDRPTEGGASEPPGAVRRDEASGAGPKPAAREHRPFATIGPRWLAMAVAGWVVTTMVCFTLVVYALGPMVQAGDQRAALTELRADIDRAVGQTQSLLGATEPIRPGELGHPVAVIEIGKLRLQQVVFEGVMPAQTTLGPGHVPGTSGLGQPGNAAVVGRNSGYGGPFSRLPDLRRGDAIVVATTQGKSVYRVSEVRTGPLDEIADYGETRDDRLTLVTSASWWPLSDADATVVTATMEGKPFPPTPQHGKTDAQDGRSGDSTGWALLILSLGSFIAVAAGATYLYRRWRPVSTYIITAPALLVLAVLSATALWRLLPAWA